VKVLVTGAGGQLGLDVLDAFADVDITGLTASELDVGDEAAVAAAMWDLAPDVVINAAAWTDVDGCESDPTRAHRVNALGPWWLARACAHHDATLVTISTDYVFDGVAPSGAGGAARGFTEFDPVAPINAYGRSKWAGEQLVRETLPRHHIVRTAWLAGARGNNFVRTMLRVGRERGAVAVVDDQIGSPTLTRDLAAALRRLAVSGRYGTINLTNRGQASWFDLAAATFELAGIDVELTRQSSADLDRPAPRPAWSVLDGTHADATGIGPLPEWRDGLTGLLRELGELR
jgi:dTDP-4-dehydrorhamnose reductase